MNPNAKMPITEATPNPNDPCICPAGHTECCSNDSSTLPEFKKMKLQKGKLLPSPHSKMHRIIFLISGSLHIQIDNHTTYELNEGECMFLVRDRNATITVTTDTCIYLLDTGKRVLFCKHDVLNVIPSHANINSPHSPILPIHPSLESFLNSLQLSRNKGGGLDKPCYHVIKEYEFIMIMWYAYGVTQLGSFFREALLPRDDFRAFVLCSYDKVGTMSELASLANMSESTFRRVFTATFNETYQSWRVKQKATDIVNAIKDGVTSNAELMKLFGFKTYPVFYRFCTQHLHGNPSYIKEKYAAKIIV